MDETMTLQALREALKPCPFCGSTDLRARKDEVAYSGQNSWIVLCRGCGANGANVEGEDAAISAWNRRAKEALVLTVPGETEIDGLRKAIEACRHEDMHGFQWIKARDIYEILRRERPREK
jgi:Lar family restriction alleviation protein